ncbi:hypothetical protein EB118_09715 [bacterium]|nr:hypothetical protein [Actinomycetota bacterium]NDG30334.1 hypothetical protein [bacterium]
MSVLPILLSASAILSNCGGPNDLATINNYGIVPDTPIAGQNMTLWIDYTLKQDVTGGIAVYEANLNGIPYIETNSLCTQTECPIVAGQHNESSISTFPNFVGKLMTVISWEDENSLPILCVRAVFKN